MRGTGRSCAAAPNTSSFSGTSCFVMFWTQSFDVRTGAGLLVRLVFLVLVGLGDFALLVMAEHRGAAHRIDVVLRARRHKIARIGNHGGDVVLNGAAEIG